MRVLFTPFPSSSHVNNQVPLAWALRAAGHEVCMATQPDATEDILGAGLTAVPVGDMLDVAQHVRDAEAREEERPPADGEAGSWLDTFDISETRTESLTYDYLHGTLTAWTNVVLQNTMPRRALDELVAFTAHWHPDLVIWDPMYFAGAIAAKSCGAAHARFLFGLDVLGNLRRHYLAALAARPATLREDPLAEWLGRFGSGFTEDLVVGQWTLDPVPSSLALDTGLPRVGVRYVPYNGASVVPDWIGELEAGTARVCITLGMAHREVWGTDRLSVGRILQGVADLGVEVIATLDDVEADGVRVVDFVPLDVLLPLCSAVVSHGGAGSFQTALVHGVPQVVVPDMLWDTGLKARRLAGSGAGLYANDLTGLRDLVGQALHDRGIAAAARRLRSEALAMPAPSEVVALLERLTAANRPTAAG
ncbi:activator-dependent family glycosyltransferase [Micromonospora aurantiaca]|uniref:Activator-dependent family glycosyltransferase n=1 Tax=Micromonospora aurantiaca (nom. illeg.) TaxID=47850 RepID=A0ABQ6UIW5_9ACTN|nr:activator-dependent family glycosyltransferase [Micromonospora aurantiaca]KAB1116495.1 activator-dependent family glycosyltransferase [Micromonospora aurantiaca]UFN92296.1 activator-dependent family glycosyltransferase [Micromonospora aurantiaca]